MVDVVELIFVLAVIFFEVVLIYLFQVVKIVRAFGIDALVEDKVFPVLFGNEGISTVRAAQLYGGEAAFGGRKPCSTDLTEEMLFGAVILVKKRFRCVTVGEGTAIRDIAFRAAADRADLFTIAFLVVRDEVFVVSALTEVSNPREFINLKLLVFWGMGVIKSPLFEWNISADEV